MLAVIAMRTLGSVKIAVVATSAAVLISPHALPYDLVLLALPAWLAVSLHRVRAIPNPAPAALLIALALVIDLGRPLVSLAPLVMLALLAWYARSGWLRRRRHPPVASIAA
jgi:hypothetical protein